LSSFEFEKVFSFDDSIAPLANEVTTQEHIATATPEALHRALEAAGEAAYHWSIATDSLTWSENAAQVLGCAASKIASGKLFASFMDAENLTSRFDTVMRTQKTDDGKGVAFRIEYLFKSEGRDSDKSVWVEDQGRWYAGPDGHPAEVYGTLRPINDRYKRDQHLNFLGNCDPLTGMMNRGRMTEALGEAISVAVREQGHCAFAIASVNNLSVVNEAYGFEVADEVIVALGRRLREVMRSGDGIARYSGGKFGIILNNCDEAELRVALERYLAVVRESVIETQHGPVWAMLSIGALCLPAQAQDANTATARAEEALNEAGRMPSDGYVIFKPSDVRTNERRLNARCATEIVKCLKADLFKLAFQPIVSAQTGEIVLHEALLRMADEQSDELIAAQHLMPVSERLGLVRLIDRSVTQMIVSTLHRYPDSHLAMNVSATTATDPRWYNQLLEIIAENSSVAHRLTVEITETVALSDIEATRYFVENLRRSGCKVAIDDFGAGYTSFRNLRDLHVDLIKLDGSFCTNLRGNPENEYFVRSLIDMGNKFGLKTVAEWIETQDDADLLREWGIDYLQGHLIGQASIVPPWSKVEESIFAITPHPVVELVSSPAVEIDHEKLVDTEIFDIQTEELVSEPEPILLSTEPEELKIEPVPVSEKHVDLPETFEPAVELNFDGMDESISALKETLAALRGTSVETELSEESERNAA
jgi:diguanylate cyclase (GGDEF)-like protein